MVLLIQNIIKICRGKIFILSPLFFLLLSSVEAKDNITFYSSDCPKCKEIAREFSDCFSEDFNIIFADTRIPAVRQEMRERSKGRVIFPPCAFYKGKLYADDELFTILLADASVQQLSLKTEKNLPETKNILTVLIAGFLDGINPCALTVIIFFISAAVRSHLKIILPLCALISGIFISYLITGIFGLKVLSALYHSPLFNLLNNFLLTLTAILFFLSLADLISLIKSTKTSYLSLPRKNILLIHQKIREILKIRSMKVLCASAFTAGIIISFFELLCTGQIYLPVINLIAKEKGKSQALMMLIIYNLAFVIPLLIASAISKFLLTNLTVLKHAGIIFRILMPILFIWLFYIQL